MDILALVKLVPVMNRTSGVADIKIGLIDGPVAMNHAELRHDRIHTASDVVASRCSSMNSLACQHGTFIAGILVAKRGSAAPAICPDCTLLVRPIFTEPTSTSSFMPSATPEELATAIIDCVNAGAHIINLSIALAQPSVTGQSSLEDALNYATQHGVIVVTAAGNQGVIGSSAITRHPWVIPVAACDWYGRPVPQSNLGKSIGRRGLSAPGEGVTSLGTDGQAHTLGGTSVAAPFVTGTVALLWSEFPQASAAELKLAVTQAPARRKMIVPPVLDAWGAYQVLATNYGRR